MPDRPDSVTGLGRRDFCKTGMASAALIARPASLSAHALDRQPGLILFDRRSAAATALARQWQRESRAALIAFAGDMTDVWLAKLHGRWDQRTPAIGGLTSPESLFCLERLAWDAGQRVHWRQPLAPDGDLVIHRWLIAPKAGSAQLPSGDRG